MENNKYFYSVVLELIKLAKKLDVKKENINKMKEEFFNIVKEDEDIVYSGVFWIKDINNLTKELFFKIPTFLNGEIINEELLEYPLNSKSKNTYNHKKLWEELPSFLTLSYSFNHYPRGRVMIKNNIIDIYININLNKEKIRKYIINEFKLNNKNIKKIRWLVDNSDHYKSYLDR